MYKSISSFNRLAGVVKSGSSYSVLQNSNFHIAATPFNVGANNNGADLDIKLELYNNSGTLINTYDPAESMGVSVDTILNAGTYYIKIDGSGNINTGEYGSLGAYTLSGTGVILPIHDVALTGTAEKGKHNLAWNIIADEPVNTIEVQIAADGTHFKTLTTAAAASRQFSYIPFENQPEYYRLKVTSSIGQEAYSNTLFLKGISANPDNNFKVSTFIEKEITVNATVPFQYLVSDINGRVIRRGTGVKGFNSLNISSQPAGMYIMQLFSNNQQQSERIIKQ